MKIIDGKLIANEIKKDLIKEVLKLKETNIIPGLGIILVGHNEASEIYVRNKIKVCEELGIKATLYRYNDKNTDEEIIAKIKELNNDRNIDGILVQSPLPNKFDENKIISYINPSKDVDGFGTYNLGALFSDNEQIIAATPLGILKMLDYINVSISGKNVVVIGSSIIVGRPMAAALLNRGATVTIAHSQTKNLQAVTKQADILIVAIGHAKFITDEYIKEGAIVIDVGTNRIDNKLYGDVDFDKVSPKCSYITKVPGGVGPMTIIMLLSNLIIAAKRREK